MRVVAVIPARMGSSRFPGKPLASLAGRPMIEHVYQRVRLADVVDAVYIATCDEEIRAAATAFKAEVIMTSDAHERASDRVAEAARHFQADVVLMVQGDEPLITPGMIAAALAPFDHDPDVLCTNLAAPITSQAEFEDHNTIKVAMALNGDALYFSREAIPTLQRLPFGRVPAYKQVCVIPFRCDFLATYTALQPTPLEHAESIDMLRALEHGYPIRLVKVDEVSHSVDTPEDLLQVERIIAQDQLTRTYAAAG